MNNLTSAYKCTMVSDNSICTEPLGKTNINEENKINSKETEYFGIIYLVWCSYIMELQLSLSCLRHKKIKIKYSLTGKVGTISSFPAEEEEGDFCSRNAVWNCLYCSTIDLRVYRVKKGGQWWRNWFVTTVQFFLPSGTLSTPNCLI